ncbi:amidohydrolase family protein [Aminithiophilus ramosus]|uniref:Amidohydrolase family protein n=1 Tax=Aminithiophilus ramosus TaxID=3029084 RepID=A0A9Q7F069_9BACT|nr:amidohydrolase family protein [Aminithiophilus ramosus]QTX32877.1 amidohydrolase family protein [Aminithiophilus ramosus]
MTRRLDTHVHVYSPELIRTWKEVAEEEPYFGNLASGKVHRWARAEDVLDAMDHDGVDESWICGFAFSDMGLCRSQNDYVIESVRRSGGRLRGMAVVPPLAPGAEEEILRCREAGLVGVGELFPQGQGLDITDIRQTWRLVGACHEAGLFLLLHTAEPVGHDYPGKGSVGPKEAAAFCTNHPEATVILAHWGGGLWLYEQMAEMRRVLRNAWYDVAATPFLYGPSVFRAAFAAEVGEKLLLGTDFPILRRSRYDALLELAGLDEGQRRVLEGENGERLLGTLGR